LGKNKISVEIRTNVYVNAYIIIALKTARVKYFALIFLIIINKSNATVKENLAPPQGSNPVNPPM
jgi:hypothetical protein